jgi:hypothetical protein
VLYLCKSPREQPVLNEAGVISSRKKKKEKKKFLDYLSLEQIDISSGEFEAVFRDFNRILGWVSRVLSACYLEICR